MKIGYYSSFRLLRISKYDAIIRSIFLCISKYRSIRTSCQEFQKRKSRGIARDRSSIREKVKECVSDRSSGKEKVEECASDRSSIREKVKECASDRSSGKEKAPHRDVVCSTFGLKTNSDPTYICATGRSRPSMIRKENVNERDVLEVFAHHAHPWAGGADFG